MRRLLGLAVLLGLAALPAAAQPLFPDPGPVFDDGRVPSVHVTLDPDTLAWILDPANAFSDYEWRAEFVWDDGVVRDTVADIGFRLRGNTSRMAAKKSFKISFNTYVAGREWEGLDKLNLNGEHNDPSIIRSKLAWGLVRDAQVPGSRVGFVRLYINGDYFGVYANVEHIDEEFLKAHFRDDTGTLYKCLYPADLAYLGDDPQLYRDLMAGGRPVYELKEGDGDHVDLAHFIGVLNQTPEAGFPEAVEDVLDVNGYLRALAVDVLTGNWDGYAWNQNNYYLYRDPEIGRFRYLPYDLDNTWGIDFVGGDWGTRSVYAWPNGPLSGDPPRPLAKRLLRIPDYRDRFTFYLRRLLDTVYTSQNLDPRMVALRDRIEDDAAEDPYRPLDYGWTMDDFFASYVQPLGGHVDYGLTQFVATRHTFAGLELETVDVPPLISERRLGQQPLLPGVPVTVRAWIEDEATPAAVRVHYDADGGWQSAPMAHEGDGVYAASLGPFEAGATVRYYVEAEDVGAQTRTDPRAGADGPASFTLLTPGGIDGLHVNELMASNDGTIADEHGEFEDWVELYNGAADPVSLAGLYLTDDLTEPDKFALPDTTIAPGGFVLVWTDGDDDQGPMHASFSLSAGGEHAALFLPDGQGGFTFVSGITFGALETDVSYGRRTDGAATWMSFGTPTPGASNNTSTANEPAGVPDRFALTAAYPNPFRDAVTLTVALPRPARLTLDLYDVLGRRVGTLARQADAGPSRLVWSGRLAAGHYVARLRADYGAGPSETITHRLTVAR